MINAIIIDDEQHCTDRLTLLLSTHHQHTVRILATCSSVDEGIKAIESLNPDFIFLDVQIHERTGFDLLKHFSKINFKVIFTTAYDKFAVQAIKFSALDYLLKPVSKEELDAALKKLSDGVSMDDMRKMISTLSENISPVNKNKTITVPSGNQLLFIPTDEIIRCHSDANYTTIYKKDNQKIVVAKTLKEFEELLSDHNFFRVHNSDLINLDYIKSYNKGKGGSVLLIDGTEIEVSSRRKDDFLQKLKER